MSRRVQEKMYSRRDTSLKFVNGPDELDFVDDKYQSARAAMSCGHAVTPMSLTTWCRHLLSQGLSKFTCPVERKDTKKKCDTEWPYTEVRKMALLTPEEKVEFEEKLSCLALGDYSDIKQCPGCSSSVIRRDLSDLSVHCTTCSTDKKRKFYFCWQCMKEWKGPMPKSDQCGNAGCFNADLEVLRSCADITFESVKDVTGCPSIRACPTCGIRVEHDKEACKNITCPRCEVEFCFVCLKRTTDCLKAKSSSWFTTCSSGVAPRQTSIPVWKRL